MTVGDGREVLFPIRSNAHSLLAGAPVASVRARLKTASILYDSVFLEAGLVTVQAGSQGSSEFWHPPDGSTPPRWQTATERGRLERSGFSLAIGAETEPGVPAESLQTILESDSEIAWHATLMPFMDEFPAGVDWIEFVGLPPLPEDIKRLEARWSSRDQRNPALDRLMPMRFVRDRVIKHTNHDLAVGLYARSAVSGDRLHQNVMTARFQGDSSWTPAGWALPILFPDAGLLAWDAVVSLRSDRAIQHFRAVLREVEEHAVAEVASSSGGDVERAVHTVYEQKLREAVGRLDGLGAVVKRSFGGLIIGLTTGVLTMGIAGPAGIPVEAALGASAGAALDLRKVFVRRRRAAWIGFDEHLRSSS